MSTTEETSEVRTAGETSDFRTTEEASQVRTTGETLQVQTTGETSEVRTTEEASQVRTTGETLQVRTTGETSEVRTTEEASQVQTTEEASEDRNVTFAERFNNFIAFARRNRCRLCAGLLAFKIVIFLIVGRALIDNSCHLAPGIELEYFAIRDMAVFHNVTATNSTPWQVSSDIKLSFSFKNRNGVFACFTTPFRTEVSVYYAGNSTISESEIPLYFTLKPERSRGVSAQLLEERFVIVNDSAGSALAADLRSDNITLQLELATRYSQSEGTIKWIRSLCEVVARTPLKTNSLPESLLAINSRPESLLGKKCVNMK